MTLTLIVAFALTIVVETLIASAILHRFVWLEAAAIQCATWPFAQLLVWRTGAYWPVEIGVAIVETILWRAVVPISWRRAAMVSFVANAATAAIGALRHLLTH